jgi:predicted outer membrane repeat protein
MRSVTGTRALAGLAAMAALALPAGTAAADTITPTRFDDPQPAKKCKPTDCSLREAIRTANNREGRDTVLLGNGTYELEIPPADAFNTSGQLYSSDRLVLRGAGHKKTTIDANGLDRVIAIVDNASIEHLTMTGGDAGASPYHDSRGGAILTVAGKVDLKNVTLTGNTATYGGAISAVGESLNIEKSTIRGNSASEGGGIHAPSRTGSLPVTELRASTVSGNTATKGGGILADGSASFGPTEPIFLGRNSTVAGNFATDDGGGVMSDNGASVIFSNSTIAYNTAESGGSGGGSGGGVRQGGTAFFNLYDSIVAANTLGPSGTGAGCSGSFAGDGNVLIASSGCESLGVTGNQFVGSALIGQLADNGGPTKTIALKSMSPAIGYAINCPGADQRGVKRPAEGCDSGAFERKGP